MTREIDWSGSKSHIPFFLNHEFFIPLILFCGMLVTEKVRLYLSVMGFKIYDPTLINPLLFYAAISYLAVAYSFKSFLRWSHFRLSQYHPIINVFLNFTMLGLPILTIIVNPLLIFPLLAVHWFSHVRSPSPAEAKGRVGLLSRSYTLIILQMALCFVAYYILSKDITTLRELTLWTWLKS